MKRQTDKREIVDMQCPSSIAAFVPIPDMVTNIRLNMGFVIYDEAAYIDYDPLDLRNISKVMNDVHTPAKMGAKKMIDGDWVFLCQARPLQLSDGVNEDHIAALTGAVDGEIESFRKWMADNSLTDNYAIFLKKNP